MCVCVSLSLSIYIYIYTILYYIISCYVTLCYVIICYTYRQVSQVSQRRPPRTCGEQTDQNSNAHDI